VERLARGETESAVRTELNGADGSAVSVISMTPDECRAVGGARRRDREAAGRGGGLTHGGRGLPRGRTAVLCGRLTAIMRPPCGDTVQRPERITGLCARCLLG
jgi:hypothetical protein